MIAVTEPFPSSVKLEKFVFQGRSCEGSRLPAWFILSKGESSNGKPVFFNINAGPASSDFLCTIGSGSHETRSTFLYWTGLNTRFRTSPFT